MQLMSQLTGNALSCSGRKFELNGDTAIIGLREELCLDNRSKNADSTDKHTYGNENNDCPMSDTPADKSTITS